MLISTFSYEIRREFKQINSFSKNSKEFISIVNLLIRYFRQKVVRDFQKDLLTIAGICLY